MSPFALLFVGALASEPIEASEKSTFDPIIVGGTTFLRDPLVFQGVAYLTDPLVRDAIAYVEASVINDAKIDWFMACEDGVCVVEIGEATECATYDHPDGTIVVCE